MSRDYQKWLFGKGKDSFPNMDEGIHLKFQGCFYTSEILWEGDMITMLVRHKPTQLRLDDLRGLNWHEAEIQLTHAAYTLGVQKPLFQWSFGKHYYFW